MKLFPITQVVMDSRYERNIFLLLSFYRFLTYGLAVILIQTFSLESEEAVSREEYTLIIGIGIYSLLKVLVPLRWRAKGSMTYVLLSGDVLVCLVALLLTGGLNSGFLFYSLTPIMTAALLFNRVLAMSMAAVTSGSLALAHLVLYRWFNQTVWIMEENNFLWLGIFFVGTVAIAYSLYKDNLNICYHVGTEAVVKESCDHRHL